MGQLSTAFLAKFFPTNKTNTLRGRISSFQQQHDESIPKACERFKITLWNVLIMGWRIGYSYKHSTMG